MQPWDYNAAKEDRAVTIPMAREVAGKKFMWDGAFYVTKDDAKQAMDAYKKEGFEVHIFLEDDKYLVFNRKLVSKTSFG
jgi:hypothetical protein